MKFALIGCGAQGRAYAAAAAELGLEMALCADPRSAAAKKAAASCGARATTKCNSVLDNKDIRAILLCAPAKALPAYVRLAAKARKHALVAPSLAPDPESARKVLDAARAAGIHVYAAHTSRVAPEHAAIAAQLDQGAIGRPGFARIVRVGAAPDAKASAGALASLLPDDLDWLAGRFGRKARIFAQTARAPGVDHAALTLTFPDGPIVQWAGTCRAHGESPLSSVEICGNAGMIQFTTDDLVLEFGVIAKESAARSSPLSPSLAGRHLIRFAALIESAPSAESYEHDLAVLRLLDAATQSARTGRAMAV